MRRRYTDLSEEAPGSRAALQRSGPAGIGDRYQAVAAALGRGSGLFALRTAKAPRQDDLSDEQPTHRADALIDATARPDLEELALKITAPFKIGVDLTSKSAPTSPKGIAIAHLIGVIGLMLPVLVLGAAARAAGAPTWAWLTAAGGGLVLAVWHYRIVNRRR